MMPTIVILESSDIGARYTAEAIRRLGCEALFLTNGASYQADTRAQLAEARCLECDTNHVTSILKTLADNDVTNIAGLTTFLDSRLGPAVLAAQQLNVAGIDPAVLALKDKGHVTQLIPEWSPPTITFEDDKIPFDKIRALVNVHGRAVLKPTKAAGGIGNYTITAEDVTRIPELIAVGRPSAALDDGTWVVQAYLKGPLVSAEGFVRNGRAQVLGLNGRHKIGLTESRMDFPVDQTLTARQIESCRTAVQTLSERANFRNGYFHIEFILTEQQPYVIDANVGRLGGGSVGEQLALSFDVDPQDVFEHVLRVSLFPSDPASDRSPYGAVPRRSVGILYGLSEPGVLQDVIVPDDSKCYHTQILEGGQLVPPMGVNNWSWLGIYTGLEDDVTAAIARLRIRADGQEQTPCF